MDATTVYLLVMMFPGFHNATPLPVPGIVSEVECFRLADDIKKTQSDGNKAGVQCYPYKAFK